MPMPFSDLPAFRRDPLKLLLDRAASAKPGFVPIHLGLRPIWLATDPEIARLVLKWSTDDIDKGRLVQTLQPLVGNSLLTNIRGDHAKAKHAMHRHVHRNSVTANLDRMIAIIDQFISRVLMQGRINTDAELASLAFQLACIVVFGQDTISAADRTLLVQAVRTVEAAVASSVFRLPFLPRWPKEMRREVERLEHAAKVIALVVGRARANENRSGVIRGLEDSGLDDQSIISEILGLLIAGHHTTGATMGWIIHHMAEDPEIAEMIALEADEILPALERNDATSLKDAPLSHAFISEILRLYPAGWWTSREIYRPVEIGNKRFGVGEMIMVAPWQLHRDARFWSMPDTLLLDRSFKEEAYMPFGIGPRACIGMSIAWFELQLMSLQLASALRFKRISAGTPKPRPSITLLFPGSDYEVAIRDSVLKSRSAA